MNAAGRYVVDLGSSDECQRLNEECPHHMHPRCPRCATEMWAPSVFGFSHGDFHCRACRRIVIPTLHGVLAKARQ